MRWLNFVETELGVGEFTRAIFKWGGRMSGYIAEIDAGDWTFNVYPGGWQHLCLVVMNCESFDVLPSMRNAI